MNDEDPLSFTHPTTQFRLLRSHSPPTVDGFPLEALTGEVECMACGSSAMNVDEIDHDDECDQADVHSRYWRETH
ncbi:hypothetical protein [Halostella sp. PRR32]|uniref:hypothetical protein n=1 Tax=Halostella sp. PRR32 TaxID=3098147 RepID=UPI002B1D9F29|nr:hypothetical protein [Halostella sp. PRR32]